MNSTDQLLRFFCSVCRSLYLCVCMLWRNSLQNVHIFFPRHVYERSSWQMEAFRWRTNTTGCFIGKKKCQERLLLTMIVVTITVRFSMPDVSLGSKAWSWVRTSLSASFQYPIWRWNKHKNESPDPTESNWTHASISIWVSVCKCVEIMWWLSWAKLLILYMTAGLQNRSQWGLKITAWRNTFKIYLFLRWRK